MIRRAKAGGPTKKSRSASKQVNIICRGDYCYVEPPYEAISRRSGEQVLWRATNTSATISFPTSCPFGWMTQTIPRGGTLLSGPPLASCVDGAYQYTVFCADCVSKGAVRFAVGASNPQIKIDP
jgi:hypothetical protein